MPEGHGRHLAAIRWLLNRPRSQGEHCTAPSVENWPGGHGSHLPPTRALAVPAAQGEHVGGGPTLPGGQPQLIWLGLGLGLG